MRVLITAGAAGLGRTMTETFVESGAEVAVCDVDEGALVNLQDRFPGVITRRADVAMEGEVEAFFDMAIDRWGGTPDVVCANAGTAGPSGAIEDVDYGQWRSCIAVNLHGAFLTARRAAREMKARGGGLIVFTASTAGMMGYPFRTPYASAKWAVIGLTKSLAMELGPHGIRVNALAPGALEGDRMERVLQSEAKARNTTTEAVRERYVEAVSLRTWIEPSEIASMLLYLTTPAGRNISGQVLAIDGHTEHLAG